jgi:XapX domain-containing protein
MKANIISSAIRILVRGVYRLLGVRSWTPPMIALAALPGVLVGGQAPAPARHLIAGHPAAVAWLKNGNGKTAFERLAGDTAPAREEVI